MVGGGRYDIIEAQEPRGPRRWIGAAILAALLAVPVVGMVASREPAGLPPPPAPTSAPAPSVTFDERSPNILHPEVRRRDGREIIDVVFPDGSGAEVDYPPDLRLAALGVRPAHTGWLDGYHNLVRRLTAPSGGAAEIARERPMLRTMGRRVTLWKASGRDDGQLLLFDFGPWSLTLSDVPTPMTFEQRMLWAESLRGRVTEDGYLVLSAKPPLVLGRPGQALRGEQAGPQLWFGGGREALVVLMPVPGCDAGQIRLPVIEERRRYYYGVCRNGFYLAASGTEAYVRRIINGVRITPEP
ncbi:hypothetical protein Plo01_70490 [Planobispora longispora]|uniref:Uncharacterized protein n=1 Tax=Planobispora longispora TaxID=28887 RepID=A0A8J3RTV0_9ACTN|nr:hypothetical protein Plo01_70490 [Planobispora longispora]